MSSNGERPPTSADKSLGEIVAEVSEKASQLVREEIELAKAEVTGKLSKLGRGAAVGAAAGVFAIFGVTMLFHTLAWFFDDLFNWNGVWPGYLVVTILLFLLTAIAGLLAARWLKSGSPPTPDLAIEEAKRTREQLEAHKIERDQIGRTLERGEEVGA
jgi:uncharacterized membrane protein YqjE